MIAFLKQSQGSSFSNYDESMAESWKKIQKRENWSVLFIAGTKLMHYSVRNRGLRNYCTPASVQQRSRSIRPGLRLECDRELRPVQAATLLLEPDVHRCRR